MIWVLIGIVAVLLAYIYLIKPHRYWKDQGVAQSDPVFLFGDNWEQILRKQSFLHMVNKLYNDAGDNRYYGFYQTLIPTLMIKDLELLKQVAVKDFDHFQDHRPFLPEDTEPLWEKNLFALRGFSRRYYGFYQTLIPTLMIKDLELLKQVAVKDFDHFQDHMPLIPEKSEPLWEKNLSALRGQKWKDMRATLSPSFTSSKMRTIFYLVSECADKLTEHFLSKSDEEMRSLEMKDLFTRFANDVIASVAFGIKCDSLEKRNDSFYLMGKAITNFGTTSQGIKIFLLFIVPKLTKLLGLKLFSEKATQFFRDIVTKTIKEREEKNIVRPDMIHLLMEARKNGTKYEEEHNGVDAGFATVQESDIGKSNKHITYKLTDDDITAQGLIFFFAGFDTVSSAMSFVAYELAVNPDVQDRLLSEIEDTLEDCRGKLTYEALMKMKYLDMVVSESLRKWPPLPAVDRMVTKPYVIQPTNKNEKPVHLKVKDVIWIPVVGFHYDPAFYPNPDKYDPERFSDENKANINPYTYLPFGVGPRNCIGSRFALLEIKTAIFHLVSKFELVVTERTQIPLQLSKKSFNVNSENGIWIGFRRRSKTN